MAASTDYTLFRRGASSNFAARVAWQEHQPIRLRQQGI
jgi:hypothetical protein